MPISFFTANWSCETMSLNAREQFPITILCMRLVAWAQQSVSYCNLPVLSSKGNPYHVLHYTDYKRNWRKPAPGSYYCFVSIANNYLKSSQVNNFLIFQEVISIIQLSLIGEDGFCFLWKFWKNSAIFLKFLSLILKIIRKT